MLKIPLDRCIHQGTTIMIFTEGTILKPKSLLSLYNHNSYIPIGYAVEIIKKWQNKGANITYCTSRRKQVFVIEKLLKKHNFTWSFLVSRDAKESYKDIIESIKPNILIEDDCKSIGGSWQMCITKIEANLKQDIKSIVVPEFKGIDNLPLDLNLLKYK